MGKQYDREMPLYEYFCDACEASFESLSSRAGADDAICPMCGSSRTRRLLSVIGGLGGQERSSSSVCACGGSCSCR